MYFKDFFNLLVYLLEHLVGFWVPLSNFVFQSFTEKKHKTKRKKNHDPLMM